MVDNLIILLVKAILTIVYICVNCGNSVLTLEY